MSKTLRDFARLRGGHVHAEPGQPFHYIEIGDLAADGAATSHVVPGEEAPAARRHHFHRAPHPLPDGID